MQTRLTIGIKFTFEELKNIYKTKNVEWEEEYEFGSLEIEDFDEIFTDLPEEIYNDDDYIILGFDISIENRESNKTKLIELGNLHVDKNINDKLDLFLKNNNIQKEKNFFFTIVF